MNNTNCDFTEWRRNDLWKMSEPIFEITANNTFLSSFFFIVFFLCFCWKKCFFIAKNKGVFLGVFGNCGGCKKCFSPLGVLENSIFRKWIFFDFACKFTLEKFWKNQKEKMLFFCAEKMFKNVKISKRKFLRKRKEICERNFNRKNQMKKLQKEEKGNSSE